MTEEIDRDGPDHPYVQLAAIIRARIESGAIPPGRRIPSMREAGEQFGVADHTWSRAVGLLVAEGLVEVRPNRGAFVVRKPDATPERGRG